MGSFTLKQFVTFRLFSPLAVKVQPPSLQLFAVVLNARQISDLIILNLIFTNHNFFEVLHLQGVQGFKDVLLYIIVQGIFIIRHQF
jgi:hypothetical protein